MNQDNGAKRLTLNSFREQVMNSASKHIALMVYDQEESGSEDYTKVFDSLADSFKDRPDILVAALTMDIDSAKSTFRAEKLPYIMYMSNTENRDRYVPYTGEMVQDGLVDFFNNIINQEQQQQPEHEEVQHEEPEQH